MRLLASTDIALRVLMLLAEEAPDRPVSVDVLARRLGGLSRHHLHKIVQDLTRLGVTRTMRGIGGGVLLAVPPDQIQLGMVVRRLEDGQALVECFQGETCACTLLPECRLRGILQTAQAKFLGYLDERTLADCLPVGSAAVSGSRSQERPG